MCFEECEGDISKKKTKGCWEGGKLGQEGLSVSPIGPQNGAYKANIWQTNKRLLSILGLVVGFYCLLLT